MAQQTITAIELRNDQKACIVHLQEMEISSKWEAKIKYSRDDFNTLYSAVLAAAMNGVRVRVRTDGPDVTTLTILLANE